MENESMLIPRVIKLTMAAEQLRRWRPLLWQGVMLEVEVGGSIEDMLMGWLGLDRELVENRIRTVFLNGRPVDDLASAIVEEGAQIALAGAVPGMAGIAMRRQSPAGLMRQEITHQSAKSPATRKKGRITIKFFNEIAEILAPTILERGIKIEAAVLNTFLADSSGVKHVEMNGERATPEDVRKSLSKYEDSPNPPVLLKLHAIEPG